MNNYSLAERRETLAGLGVDPRAVALYLSLMSEHQAPTDPTSAPVGACADEEEHAAQVLLDLGLCVGTEGGLRVAPPQAALDALIRRREREIASATVDLARHRASVGGLLDEYVQAHREHLTDGLSILRGVEAVRAYLREMAERSSATTLSVMPELPPAESVAAGSAADAVSVGRGVALRSVVPARVSQQPAYWQATLAALERGVHIRLHPSPPFQCVIYDERIAVLPLSPDRVQDGAWVITEPGLVRPVVQLAEAVWTQAVPVAGTLEEGEGQRVREIFRLLAQGQKDDSVARRLSLSVRTVRRLVALGMVALGTDSRFEAGVMAQRLGWLD